MASHELTTRQHSDTFPHAARTFCALLTRLDTGTLRFVSPDGVVTNFNGQRPGPAAELRLKDWQVAADLLRSAEIGLAECFRDGRAETADLTALLCFCAANEQALAEYFYARPAVSAWLWMKHLWRTNTRRQARRNIQAHYDLWNDFYALWLDPTMTYSSALFKGETAIAGTAALERAQIAKYERILDELAPTPAAHILEIGCGWGGFAEYAARTRGVRVTGITLSPAQLHDAQARVERAGLGEHVELRLLDYRELSGKFDHVVSIEMFESVGERYWETYFETIRARLRRGGRAVVQSITIDEKVFPRYRRGSDFIREYIFPGGMLAPIPRMVADAGRAGLRTDTLFRFGLDYAATLKYWQDRFQQVSSSVEALGFDARFRRLWRFYLSYCEAGFRSGRTDVIQMTLTHD